MAANSARFHPSENLKHRFSQNILAKFQASGASRAGAYGKSVYFKAPGLIRIQFEAAFTSETGIPEFCFKVSYIPQIAPFHA